jgi:hypothetical protein
MFWSDWGVSGRIESAYMDGTGRRTLVDTMVQWPTGLAIDYPARRLYWTDPKAYTVESVDLNGQDRQVIRRFPQSESECSWIIPVCRGTVGWLYVLFIIHWERCVFTLILMFILWNHLFLIIHMKPICRLLHDILLPCLRNLHLLNLLKNSYLRNEYIYILYIKLENRLNILHMRIIASTGITNNILHGLIRILNSH